MLPPLILSVATAVAERGDRFTKFSKPPEPQRALPFPPGLFNTVNFVHTTLVSTTSSAI